MNASLHALDYRKESIHLIGDCLEVGREVIPHIDRLYARIQEQNLLRQYDLLSNCIEIGLAKGIEFFDKYTLWALNYAAVANISQFGGRYREEPRIGKFWIIRR
jgi:hypothetical protein